ncbi:MAG: sugar ABC transporter permease [Clostridiales bacterium]|nr:sugar ABC transporter permease [Clostridiales bacterium]
MASAVAINTRRRYSRITKSKLKDYAFVGVLLLYPVLQFVVTWSFVNVGSLLLAFQSVDTWGNVTSIGFDNFAIVLKNIFKSAINDTGVSWLNNRSVILLNSLGYGAITIFISLPLSMLFAYFLQKDMPIANVFRVIFFLPNIIPIVALVMAFNMPLDSSYGYLYKIMQSMGFSGGYIYDKWPSSQMWVYLYCIWAGLGYNVVLMSGAIGRIPKEIYESAKLDGAGYMTEFFRITIPLVWPTIVTLIILGLTNVLTLYLQPYLLTNEGSGNTGTIAMEIFTETASFNQAKYNEAAAKGLLFSVVWAPIVLLARSRLSKKFSGVDF